MIQVVIFSKVSVFRGSFMFDLRCLGGHSEISPVPLGGGGLKSMFMHT